MSSLLAGRIALVTGGSRGLGAAIAAAFLSEGAGGMVLDLDEGAVVPGFAFRRADVTREDDLTAAVAECVAARGGLDIVVANAGVVPPWRETEGLDLDEWDRVMAINVRGVAATLKHAVPAMKKRGGSIVVMCSINALRSHPRQMLYTAAKHAALGIVRAAALDLGRYGIRVNGLAPGPIATDALLERIRSRAADGGSPESDALASMARDTALGRLATAADVARAAVFLASDLSSGMTGQLLPVEAGLA